MMLVLFINTLASTSLFYHVHIVDGIKLVHSHFFSSDSPTDIGHTHTKAEFISIAKISSMQEVLLTAVAAIVLFVSVVKIAGGAVLQSHIATFRGVLSLRGPPALSI